MDTSMESFHLEGRPAGALVRRRTSRACRSLLVYRDADGLHRVLSDYEHSGDVRDWTSYTRDDGDHVLRMTRADGRISVDGEPTDLPPDTIPSGMGVLVLEQMLATSATEAELRYVSADEPRGPVAVAHYSVENPESFTFPDGRREQLGVVSLLVPSEGGDLVSAPHEHVFWFDSRDIVATDWADARSYRVDTVEELVEGLDDDITADVRAFCG